MECNELKVRHADLHFTVTEVGQVAEVVCKQGYTFIDGSVRRSVYCRFGRKWTSAPECIGTALNSVKQIFE